MSHLRATGRRRVVAVTSAIAGVALLGSVGLAAVAAQSGASAETTTTTASSDTSSSDSGSWTPSTSGVTQGSGSASHATSGGS